MGRMIGTMMGRMMGRHLICSLIFCSLLLRPGDRCVSPVFVAEGVLKSVFISRS